MTRDDYYGILAEHQRLLANFLNADLDLAFTFLSLDRKESAVKAANTVRRLVERVQGYETRQKIERRLSELEYLISTL